MNVKSDRFIVKFYSVTSILKDLKQEGKKKKVKKIQTNVEEFPQERSNGVEEEEEEEKDEDAYIIESMPEKYRKKAENLLRRLRAGGGVVWNNTGAVTIDGVVVPGANIIDLINDTMRDRKRSLSVGHLQFAAALRNSAIPREFIGSKRVWREVTNIPLTHSQSASASSGGGTYRTPSHSQAASASSGGETDSDSRQKRKKVSPAKRLSWSWRQLSGLE